MKMIMRMTFYFVAIAAALTTGATATAQWDESFAVGPDTGTPVDDRDYQVPFKFTGKLVRVTLTIDPPKLTPEVERTRKDSQ